MTRIEAYKAVIANEITEEVIAKFEDMIAAHETETEKRRNRAAEKRAEKIEAEKVLEEGILKDNVEGINTPQKATVVAKRLVANGLVAVQDVKGKNGKVKGYTLV